MKVFLFLAILGFSSTALSSFETAHYQCSGGIKLTIQNYGGHVNLHGVKIKNYETGEVFTGPAQYFENPRSEAYLKVPGWDGLITHDDHGHLTFGDHSCTKQ